MTKPSAATTSSWRTITATALGASHVHSGLPNQDAVTTLALNGSGGAVAAVADGHGGTRYVRSNVGSALAVQIAGEAGRELISALGPKPDLKAVRAGLEGRLTPAVIERWRQQVLEDHRLHPFTAEERARGGVDLDADPTISYGCTLIVAVLGPRWLGLVQIGDGDAILVAPDGSISTPVPTDDRLVGGETTSLCLPDAVHDARIAVVGDHLPELVVLATDGYGNSFASPTWRQEAATGLLEAVRRDGLDTVGAKLPGWLADSAAAGGDDVTMALALHQGSGPPAGAAPVARSRQEPRRWPAVASGGGARPRPAGRRRGRLAGPRRSHRHHDRRVHLGHDRPRQRCARHHGGGHRNHTGRQQADGVDGTGQGRDVHPRRRPGRRQTGAEQRRPQTHGHHFGHLTDQRQSRQRELDRREEVVPVLIRPAPLPCGSAMTGRWRGSSPPTTP